MTDVQAAMDALGDVEDFYVLAYMIPRGGMRLGRQGLWYTQESIDTQAGESSTNTGKWPAKNALGDVNISTCWPA
jgi:hypothetical protein